MSSNRQRLAISLLPFFAVCVATAQEEAKQANDPIAEKRTALWKGLFQACPEKYRNIEVYGEDAALTKVCFRSEGVTLLYSAKSGKVEVVQHAKMLPPHGINAITFSESSTGGDGLFTLWSYGREELKIGAN